MEILFELYKGRVKGKFLGPTEDKPNRHMYYIEGKQKTGVSTICGIKDKSRALIPWSQEETAKYMFALLETKEKITEEHLIKAAFASDERKTKAADLGTAVHDWVENYIRHRLKENSHKTMPDMPENASVLQGVTSFLKWESEHKVKFLWTEKILYSLAHDYIGRADFGAVIDGLACLCDLKSGNGLYNEVRMQTAAYAMADTEESKTKYDGRWAIRISKETEQEYLERMALKNKIKKLLRKNESIIKPYKVFEAKFLDNEKSFMKRDFNAFINALNLMRWDHETDFFKEG